MHDTEFKVVEKWTKYNERELPVFHLEWLNYKEFSKLVKDAVEFFLNQSRKLQKRILKNLLKNEY